MEVPEKNYFSRIGEIAEILDLEPYVLRYWESEFKILKPTRTCAQQRLYHRRDLDPLIEIKDLLYNEKLTIAGARRRLQKKKKRNGNEKVITLTKKEDLGKIEEMLNNHGDYVELNEFGNMILEIRAELEELTSRITT